MIKRLIFDVDNTIIPISSYDAPIKNVLKEYGIYTDEMYNKCISGCNTYESIYNYYDKEKLLKHLSKEMSIELDTKFLDIFFKGLITAIPYEYSDIVNTIKELSKTYELVILSNWFKCIQSDRLKNMGILMYFKEIYGEDIIKPNREAFLKACGPYQPRECVMIGDSLEKDIEGAKRCGLKTIHIGSDIDSIVEINKEMIEERL